ncbi:OHCU decarboxylase [Pseudoalteromonas sp. NBT06-2]|uniref:2-oxo-4-hydroxy-4-carboxy-5-ureidoimidazoline decarboxylase n=1 Tax=Pseudoalteromonas sp. NBT06-2 TaxID=2025950 RepID=UPI000BA62B2B|nr:2-oxo-4-hydroxy-4-carboxy-5-ureidoimidazoline decarboxylase [Pseudoalteromonas sp. NBT06-2]PAJ75038.1 OHCU decarboxylase [Pseudoalteromonas sp. NBT06-2]
MNFQDINAMDVAQAKHAFMQCCTSSAWVSKMVESRPYVDLDALFEAANSNWIGLSEGDYLEAFDGHPKIGDVSSLMKKYANTKRLAAGEQSGMNAADEATIKALAKGNDDYHGKFGFIFIVCATGKSAAQMLALLEARIDNDRETEFKNAAEEQRKIFHIRLNKFS